MRFVQLEVGFAQCDLEGAARSALLGQCKWLEDGVGWPENLTRSERRDKNIAEKLRELLALRARRRQPLELNIPLYIAGLPRMGFLYSFGNIILSNNLKPYRFMLLYTHGDEPSGAEYYLLFIAATPPPDPAHPWLPAQVVNRENKSLMKVWVQTGGISLNDEGPVSIVQRLLPGVVHVTPIYSH